MTTVQPDDIYSSQGFRQVMITESVRRTGLVPAAPAQGRVHDAVSVVLCSALESSQDSWAVVPQKWRPAFSAAGPLPCWYRMNAASP